MIDSNKPSQVISEISILYELALGAGRTLDLEQNCDRFLKTLMSRKNLAFAAVWLKREHLASEAESGDDALCLVYAHPRFRIQEEVLLRAGIKHAKGLAAMLGSDADNLYLTMTAKLINPGLFVLSRVMEEEAEKKILQIGANKVVRPYKLSALKIAQGLLRPALVDFMDLIIRRQELSLVMEELVVHRNAQIAGHNLRECNIRQQANVIVVALKKPAL